MGVKKLKATTMLYSRLLSEKCDDVRRSAKEKVTSARGTICRSENIVAQSREALEKADKTIRKAAADRSARAAKKQTSKESRGRH